jgi:hypothetical protein
MVAALLLYTTFFLETHQKNFSTTPDLLTTLTGWVIMGEMALIGGIILLTLYQQRSVLLYLAHTTWLATYGTATTVFNGIDVSRSLHISQHERQALAQQAEQHLRRLLVTQTLLGLCVLLGLVIAWFSS